MEAVGKLWEEGIAATTTTAVVVSLIVITIITMESGKGSKLAVVMVKLTIKIQLHSQGNSITV